MDKFEKIEVSKKITPSRLEALLKLSGLNYKIDSGKIIISLPEEAIQQEIEAKEIRNKSLLNNGYLMKFRQEKIFPLVREINASSNLMCEVENLEKETILLISKK